jgi:cytochrome c oxidase subunit III
MTEQRGRLHPHKLMMWMAMGSMFMVFAGLTSAFIFQKSGSQNWNQFALPSAFWVSTVLILISSYTMHKAVNAFKNRDRKKYKQLIIITSLLGVLFIAGQCLGFYQLYQQDIQLDGNTANGFLYIISGLHIAHMIGAIIALIIIYLVALRKKVKVYSSTGIEVMATFWHFVDGLWVYLFIFFLLNFKL